MKRSYYQKPSKQAGFLLIEYLVALVLFTMVLLYIDSIIALHMRVQQKIQAQNNTVTQLRQITLQLQPKLAQSGYLGCQSVKNAKDIIVHQGIETRLLHGQSVYLHKSTSAGWQPALPNALNGKVTENTDVLVIEQVGAWTVSLLQAMRRDDEAIILPNVVTADNSWFVIDDCQTVEIFSAFAFYCAGMTCLQPQQALSKAYTEHAIVSPWVTQAYYLADDQILQAKLLQPEQAALSLHEGVEHWQLALWPDLLQIDLQTKEDFVLWFGY